MGSKNCPETPRQKMIGMMYLFLTAMLAINVSSEVLDSFRLIDESLEKTVDNVFAQNQNKYRDFKIQLDSNTAKVEDWYNLAMEVKGKSDELVTKIEQLKIELAKDADGDDYVEGKLSRIDNLDVANRVLLNGSNSKGKQLREDLGSFKNYLAKVVAGNSGLVNYVETTLETPKPSETEDKKDKDPAFKTWEYEMFGEKPVISSMALLTKIENDVRNTESITINHLFSQINAADIKVNELSAYVIPNKSYVLKGGKFSATVGVAAIDTTSRPEIIINGRPLKKGDNSYQTICNTVGKFKFKAIVKMKNADGVLTNYETNEIEYEVAEPNVNVAATKMNVFYTGVENPVRVSLPGVSSNNVRPTINNGTITASNGGYIVKPTKVGTAIVSVEAKIDGNWQKIGTGSTFRVKQLPPPSIYLQYPIAGGGTERYNGRNILKNNMNHPNTVLNAELADNEFDAKYSVEGFTINTLNSLGGIVRTTVTGNKLSREQRDIIDRLRPGTQFNITHVKAKFPDGSTKEIYTDQAYIITIR